MANYFKIGDPILFGKYKNKPGKIVRFFKDGRGLPYVEVEPIPKGRKKNREIGLFNIWHQDAAKRASALARRKQAEMSHAASIALMKWLSKVTQRMGVAQHVYVVGGAVRNFLIDQPIKDIDMVVDSLSLPGNKDAAWVANKIADWIPTQTDIVTDALMVSKVQIKGSWMLDGHQMEGNDIEIVNAREEVYEQDEAGDYLGHKPIRVDPTTLEIDVTRREFTFNTLMWSLLSLANGPERAEIIDITGCGFRDLMNREMRCPQDPDKTFRQDPTRILRTIKFAFKYGMKLPPDVKAAAKRQAKGLKRIPAKTWSVLQKIVLDNPQYKKALDAMEDLGVTDVIADMISEDQQFGSTIAKYSRNRGVSYMFDLMDMGIPVGSSMSFLSAPQKVRFRQITTPMDRDEALEFLEAVKNPGRAYKDKRFIPQLAMSKGYKGKGMAVFMPQVIEIGRELLLENPELVSNPNALKREVTRVVEGLPSRAPRQASVSSVYKPMSEISPDVQDLLDTPTPSWLDREFPYVVPPSQSETLNELDYLVSLMPKRKEWGSFIRTADTDIVGLFVDLCSELGAPCDPSSLREKIVDARVLITKLKWLYNRPRPYQVAAAHNRLGGQGDIWKAGDFSPMETVSGHTPAYPSGHTIQAALIASQLASVAPQHRRAFMDLAHKISFSRVVAGYHWPSDIVFGQDIFRHIVNSEMPSSVKVAAKFKNKREVPRADGKGTSTVYEYGPRQVQNRNKAKAERVERLRSIIGKLRKQVKSDLTSDDPKTRLAALAVALIDQTYERVGNDKSASENGHYGITTLTLDHIKMGKGKATLSYVGKSGVEHTKTVTDKPTITALKAAMKGRGKKDRLLCDGADCTVRARDVNAYLRQFDITAKDLRGMHANEEMRKRMTQIRKAGPQLPRERKERDKILKAEFKEALEGTAEAVGHKASTLKSQYLVPGMEDAFLKDGTVIDKLHKKAAIGQCYPWANQFALDKDDAEIVHGTIVGLDRQARMRPLEHAWVEWRGKVYDWQTVEAFKKPPMRISEWRKKNQAREHYRLSGEEALICSVRSGKKGPWTEAEREWVVSRRTAAAAKYEHIDFKPPKSVADAAKKGLELREKASPSNRGGLTTEQAGQMGIGSGVQRAVNLKNRNTLTPATIKKMNGFFSRHEQNKNIAPENRGKPWNDKGYVSWLLWGGDPGKSWAAKILKQMEAADEKAKKKASLSERWGALSIGASENEPTNPGLWAKVQALAKGEQKSFTHDGKTINGPNEGKGFEIFPSAYANGWASKTYGDLGGGWKKKARGKAKKDVGHGGLDEWFSGHGGAKGKGENATWGDWVAISPVEKTLESGRKVEPGDIVGPCGISKDPDWKDITDGGEDPLKCMPRDKAHDMPKKERAEKAKAKQKAEKADSSTGKKPTNTPTFEKKKASLEDQWGPMAIEASRLKTQVFLLGMPQEGRAPMGAFDENKLPKGRLRIKNRGPFPDKPKGAFWTSSLEGSSTGWIDWCSWEMPHWIGDQAVLFKPKGGAKVLWIRSSQDYQDTIDRYPAEKYGERHIDWEALSKDYDAVTCPGGSCIYGWDAESTAWFNMNALEFDRVVDVKKKCTIKDEDGWGPDHEYSLRIGTKSDAEKEDEEAQRLIRNSPKKKPPRKDLERSRIQDHKDEDPDVKQDRKDRSLNFKDIAARMQVRRVAYRFLVSEATPVEVEDAGGKGGVGGKFLEFLKEMGDKKVKNPDTGNQVKLKSLRGDKGKKIQKQEFDKWLKSNEDSPSGGGSSESSGEEEGESNAVAEQEAQEQAQEKAQKEVTSLIEGLSHVDDSLSGGISDPADDYTTEQLQQFSNTFGATSDRLGKSDGDYRTNPGKRKKLEQDVARFRKVLESTDSDGDKLKADPKKYAEALATVDYYERVLNNPLVVPDNPLSQKGGKLTGKDLEKAKEQAPQRAKESYSRYQGVDQSTRSKVSEALEAEIALLEEGSARRLELEAMRSGLAVLSAVEDGDDFEGGPGTQKLAKALAAGGNVDLLMRVGPKTLSEAQANQQEVRQSLQELDDKEWVGVLGDDSPGSPIAELLAAGTGEGEDGQFLTEDDRAFLREVLADEVLGDVMILDPMVLEESSNAGGGRSLMEQRGLPDATKKIKDQVEELLGSDEAKAAFAEEEGNRKGILDALLDIITGGRKSVLDLFKGGKGKSKSDSKEDSEEERKDGDVWNKGDKWYGKNEGKTQSFDTQEAAKDFAKGAEKDEGDKSDAQSKSAHRIGSLTHRYTFEVWGPLNYPKGQKCPSNDR